MFLLPRTRCLSFSSTQNDKIYLQILGNNATTSGRRREQVGTYLDSSGIWI